MSEDKVEKEEVVEKQPDASAEEKVSEEEVKDKVEDKAEEKEEESEEEPDVEEGKEEGNEELKGSEVSKTKEGCPYQVALENVKKSGLGAEDKKIISSLLKNAMTKKPAEKPSAESSTEKATELLEEAGTKLEEQSGQIEKLTAKINDYKQKLAQTEKTEKDLAVDKVLKKEMLMGIIGESEKEEKADIYRKLSVEDLVKLESKLKDKKVVEIKKEALKGEEETAAEVDDKLEEKKRLMRCAGISEETIKELYDKKEDD